MFSGIVTKGEGIARRIGYPTANLDISVKSTKLRDGVYAARVSIRNKKYGGALVIQSSVNKVEVYLFGYSGPDFYGVSIDVDPIQKVSEIERLPHEDLVHKIENDIKMVRQALESDDL